jgi:hypothetical protein
MATVSQRSVTHFAKTMSQGFVLREIDDAFEAEGLQPEGAAREGSGQRRALGDTTQGSATVLTQASGNSMLGLFPARRALWGRVRRRSHRISASDRFCCSRFLDRVSRRPIRC